MRRWIGWIITVCLLVGGIILCTIRWKAWFSTPPEPEWVGDTIEYRFCTFTDSNTYIKQQKDTLQFIVFGDIHNSLDNADMASVFARHTEIDFYSQLGDWMERPYFYYQQQMYKSLINTGFDSLPIIAVPGNHEYRKGIIKHLSDDWQSIFPNPSNGPNRFLSRSYFVDFPHLRIIAIDTDGLQWISDYTQTVFWLKKTLQEATNKLTVVIMHHPVFSTAKGRQNPIMWLAFYGALREADVVFSGHDHNYARHKVEYKERFWVKQQPTVFISTNASKKKYAVKEKVNYDASFSGEPVYEFVQAISDTLYIHTYNLYSSEEIDRVVIYN